MEKLKQMTSGISSFWNSASWSDKGMMIIFCGVLLYLAIRYGLMKIKSSWFKVNIGSPWRLFGRFVSLAALGGICYGFYLLAVYCWPTPEHLAFKELANNLAEKETRPGTDRLKDLVIKAKEKGLSVEEKKEAEQIARNNEKIRKNYSQGNLVSPPSKPTPAKPKEKVWIFEWTATDELMAEDPYQKPFSEYVAINVICSEKKLSFVCLKGKGKRQKDKIVLTRSNPDEYYLGYIFNKKEKKHNPIRLLPENGNFEGYISIKKGEKILATLKRQS